MSERRRRILCVFTSGSICALTLVVGLLNTQAAPPMPPRPHPPGGGGGGGDGQDEGRPSSISSSSIYGTVLNWGCRPEPHVTISLSGDGWRTEMISDDNGYFALGGLGIGVGVLDVETPPWLKSTISEVAVRFDSYNSYEFNPVLYSGDVTPVLPVAPSISADRSQVSFGEKIVYMISLTNPLGHPLSDVVLTDLLPEGLTHIRATTDCGSVEVWGTLVSCNVTELGPGEMANVTIEATVSADRTAGEVLVNRVSLLYRGGWTAQSEPVVVGIR